MSRADELVNALRTELGVDVCIVILAELTVDPEHEGIASVAPTNVVVSYPSNVGVDRTAVGAMLMTVGEAFQAGKIRIT